MEYPVFAGAEDEIQAAMSKSVDMLLAHAHSMGLDTIHSKLHYYINNIASVLYDRTQGKYINGSRGIIALLEKAGEKVQNNKNALILILNKGENLYDNRPQESDYVAYTGTELLAFINQKTKAFSPKEIQDLLKELQERLEIFEEKKQQEIA